MVHRERGGGERECVREEREGVASGRMVWGPAPRVRGFVLGVENPDSCEPAYLKWWLWSVGSICVLPLATIDLQDEIT